MPEKNTQPKEMSDGARYALIGTIITAILGLLGTGLTLYFNYLEKMDSQKLSLHATQTAENRSTQLSPSMTSTLTNTPILSTTKEIPPTITLTGLPTAGTPSLTITIMPTSSAGGVKYCVDTNSLNVRSGPGLDYPALGGLLQDTCIFFDARLEDPENKWIRISPGQDGFLQLGGLWVYGGYLRPQDFERLPVITPPPPPPTQSPTPAG